VRSQFYDRPDYQLKQASIQSAGRCIIIGQEFTQKGEIIIKDMASGDQQAVAVEEFFDRLRKG